MLLIGWAKELNTSTEPWPLFAARATAAMQQGAGQQSLLAGRRCLLALMAGRRCLLVEPAGRLLGTSVSIYPCVSCRLVVAGQATNRGLVVELARIYHNCVVRCKGRRRLLLFRSGSSIPSSPTMDFE